MSLRRIDRVLVQGKSQPVVLHEVMDADTPDRRAAKRRSLAEFDAGLASYEARDFVAAIRHFEQALAILPSDTVARFLIDRARQFARAPDAMVNNGATRVDQV